jgi:hypothetical protein
MFEFTLPLSLEEFVSGEVVETAAIEKEIEGAEYVSG